MAGFNIDDYLEDENKLDSMDIFKIVNIPLEDLIPNERNFYSTNNIENLKDDIYGTGLHQNLIVNAKKDGKFKLISGHRRFKAISELVSEGRINVKAAPCRILDVSEDEAMLILISTNATARELTPMDKIREIQEAKKVIENLRKNPDKKISGRTREYVMKLTKMTNTDISRHEVVDKKLSDELKVELENGNLSFDAAHKAASQLSPEEQQQVKEKIKELEGSDKNITANEVLAFKNVTNLVTNEPEEKPKKEIQKVVEIQQDSHIENLVPDDEDNTTDEDVVDLVQVDKAYINGLISELKNKLYLYKKVLNEEAAAGKHDEKIAEAVKSRETMIKALEFFRDR